MFKYVIFDIDGTLVDNEKALLCSLQKVLREEGKIYELDELRFALGIPGGQTLKKLGITDIERVEEKWSHTVVEFSKEISIFEGMEEVLKSLEQSAIKTGIVTSKTKQEIIDEFEPFGLCPYFTQITCADDTDKHKPDSEPMLHCLEKLGAPKEETLYIGDSIYDMKCAKAAGVNFALAFWGAKKTEGYEAADYILRTPKEILEIIPSEKIIK